MQGTPVFNPAVWRDSLILSDDVPSFVVNPCSIPIGITLNPPWVPQQFMCNLPGCRGKHYPTPFYGHVFLHVKEMTQSAEYEARFPGPKPPALSARQPDDPEWPDAYFYCHFPDCRVGKRCCWKTARERWIHYMSDHRKYFNNPPAELAEEGRLYNLFKAKTARGSRASTNQYSSQSQGNLGPQFNQERSLPEAQVNLHPEVEHQNPPPGVDCYTHSGYEQQDTFSLQAGEYYREPSPDGEKTPTQIPCEYRESAPHPERIPPNLSREYRETAPEPESPPSGIQAQATLHSHVILPSFFHCPTYTTATMPTSPDSEKRALGEPPSFDYFAQVLRARELNIPIDPPPPFIASQDDVEQ